jgi:hypothetical protein
MTAKVEKTINGYAVTARPVYKGNAIPAYWTCLIDQHAQAKTFKSANDVFKFAQKLHEQQDQNRGAFTIN